MFDEDARTGEIVKYSASNPHPLHGKDPNIMNELGHTHYPKFVDHPTEKDPRDKEGRFPLRVIVENEEAEAELLGSASTEKKVSKKEKTDWGKQ